MSEGICEALLAIEQSAFAEDSPFNQSIAAKTYVAVARVVAALSVERLHPIIWCACARACVCVRVRVHAEDSPSNRHIAAINCKYQVCILSHVICHSSRAPYAPFAHQHIHSSFTASMFESMLDALDFDMLKRVFSAPQPAAYCFELTDALADLCNNQSTYITCHHLKRGTVCRHFLMKRTQNSCCAPIKCFNRHSGVAHGAAGRIGAVGRHRANEFRLCSRCKYRAMPRELRC